MTGTEFAATALGQVGSPRYLNAITPPKRTWKNYMPTALGLDSEASGGPGIGILADLRVKHARSLGQRPLADSARDLRLRGLADAIIVSGEATGAPTDLQELATVREALPDCPLIVGSGVGPENIADYAALADGFIVGTALQENDGGRRRVSVAQTGRLIAALRAARTDQRSGR